MSVPLRVLGDRVLVKPDVLSNAPEKIGSVYAATSLAAAVTGEDATRSWSRGTVVAVGNPKHPLHDEAEALADRLELFTVDPFLTDTDDMADVARFIRDLVRREPAATVGDDVLFSHDAGQEVTLDDETYIILKEDELIAVVVEYTFREPEVGVA